MRLFRVYLLGVERSIDRSICGCCGARVPVCSRGLQGVRGALTVGVGATVARSCVSICFESVTACIMCLQKTAPTSGDRVSRRHMCDTESTLELQLLLCSSHEVPLTCRCVRHQSRKKTRKLTVAKLTTCSDKNRCLA